MLSKKIKDLKFRKLFFKYEKSKLVNKCIFFNLFSRKNLFLKNNNIFIKILKLQQKLSRISKIRLKNRCVLSNRGAGISRYYSLSRIKMRELMQFGIIPGSKKAVW